MVDWTVAVACSTFFFSVAWFARSALWAKVHIRELELEYSYMGEENGRLHEELGVLQRDVEFLMAEATGETAH